MIRFVPIFGLTVAVAFCEDKAPAIKPEAPVEDGIAAARHDFDALKAARGGAPTQADLELPHLTAPELQIGGSSVMEPRALPVKPGTEKKSANWLVDAMTKKRDQTSNQTSKAGRMTSSDREGPGLGEDQKQPSDSPDAKVDRKNEDSRPADSDPQFNPLTRYMSDWMTPQDYSLLRPGLGAATPTDSSSHSDPSLLALGSTTTLGDGGGKDFRLNVPGGEASGGVTFQMPRDNPFLQAAPLPTPPAAAVFTTSPPPQPSSSGVTPPASDPAPERTKLPDIAKPSDDAKYFKQLKRF